MDLSHITKPEDLVTSYNETRAGFITIALEKNRRATPYVEEARVLQHRIKKIESPEKLLDVSDIRNGLIAAAGLSDKARTYNGIVGLANQGIIKMNTMQPNMARTST